MNRDFRIDILRTIGVILIILAHSSPPNTLFQIRVFDVPLMAMLLGMSFILSLKGKDFKENYGKYVFKRLKRLVFPTWIFLSIFFLLVFILSLIAKQSYPFSINKIILSYTLISGIGYVWIIRVFFCDCFSFSSIIQYIKKN
jgi:fucose 4-O-acetylase-like acetyltransferase